MNRSLPPRKVPPGYPVPKPPPVSKPPPVPVRPPVPTKTTAVPQCSTNGSDPVPELQRSLVKARPDSQPSVAEGGVITAAFPRPADLELSQDDDANPARKLRLVRGNTLSEGHMSAGLNLQPKRADEVWTRAEYSALCLHLHNDNEPTHYVMGFNDGELKRVRAKRKKVGQAISWGWGSIVGTAKSKLSYHPYSYNGHTRQSRWGGLDFDAHDGDVERAERLALAAFRLLLSQPEELALILETSGSGGWHLWAISLNFHPQDEWVRLLKGVVAIIGTVVRDGICEIFPPDSLPAKFGKAMRAPGCWNPATGRCSQIVWEDTHTSLGPVLSGKCKIAALHPKGLRNDFPDNERSISFSSSNMRKAWLSEFSISTPSTRNQRLRELVGHVFHQVGQEVARWLATEQFRTKSVATEGKEQDHLESFKGLWDGLHQSWLAGLTPAEHEAFSLLETENERDAFRILLSFARKAAAEEASDFPVARDNLAERLDVTGKGAAYIRDKFDRTGVIKKTVAHLPNKSATRYRWLLKTCPDRQPLPTR